MQRWAEQTASVGNPTTSRYGHMMAYDKLRKKLVLFGGIYGGTCLNDTWELDSWNRWVQKSPASPPSARMDGVMIYHENYQRVIMLGGYNAFSGGTLNDDNIYEWDGTDWVTIAPGAGGVGGTLPGGRAGAGLAWGIEVPSMNHAYYFGGINVSGVAQNSVYALNQGGGFRYLWQGPFSPATRPSARSNFSWHFINSTKEFLLFGGYVGTPTNGETWVYNRSSNLWTQLFPVSSPTGRSHHFGFNVFPYGVGGTEKPYIFGGFTSGYVRQNDLWWYDRAGAMWNQLTPPVSPSIRANSKGDWIPELRQVYMYSGDTGGVSNQTWAWAENYLDSSDLDPYLFTVATQDPFAAYNGEMGFYPEV